MQRRILALLAAVSLLVALLLALFWPTADTALAFAWRGGAILAAAWLAYDDVQRIPNWLLLTLPVLLIVVVRWPRHLWIVAPVLLLLAVVGRLLRGPGTR